jgi:hypothetical protein
MRKSQFFRKLTSLSGVLAPVLMLVACGGGGEGSPLATTAPGIVSQPGSQFIVKGEPAVFSVEASGGDDLTYQWRKNGINIPGATSEAYETPVDDQVDGDTYSVAVSNGAGTVVSSGAALAVTAATLNRLVISEVSQCNYYTCWFEVYNPTANAINLKNFQLRTGGANQTTGGVVDSITFALPAFNIPAGGYVVIAGNPDNEPQLSNQQLWVNSDNWVPNWYWGGFIELRGSNGNTHDFVRFGNSTVAPTGAAQWTGASVGFTNSDVSNWKSIVRDYRTIATTDTNSASDWIASDWVTPGGRNDVPVGAVDADNDGIPDSAEVNGGTFAGLNLYAMGARAGKRDIFIEVDHMDSTDEGIIPQSASLAKIRNEFTAHGIAAHFDTGTQFNANFSIAQFNLGQGSNIVPYESCVTFDNGQKPPCPPNASGLQTLHDYKNKFFDIRRRPIFHYTLLVNNLGIENVAGLGEYFGNDVLIAQGYGGFNSSTPENKRRLQNVHAAVLMHELGHNLGLLHGGDDNINDKPNYWSVMNYTYSYGRAASPSSSDAYLAWRQRFVQDIYICRTCVTLAEFNISYSDGSSKPIDEWYVNEADNIGRGADAGAFADWNQDGGKHPVPYTVDLNRDGIYSHDSPLTDYNDWANLHLAFSRFYYGYAGVGPKTAPEGAKRFDPVSGDRQTVVKETPH